MKKKKIILPLILLSTLFVTTSCTKTLTKVVIDRSKEVEVSEITSTITELYQDLSKSCVGIRGLNSTSSASGSGVVYKEANGTYYVVTNEHVISDMTSLYIYLGDEVYVEATLVGSDATNDIAVLTFNKDLVPTTREIKVHTFMTDMESVINVGQTTLAIGCPLSLTTNYNYLTTGVVASIQDTFVLTDASLNPGNSGGGLFDLNGNLIGIVEKKETYTTTTSGQIPVSGFGYAISLDIVKKAITDIEANGNITRPVIGITTTIINPLISTQVTEAYKYYLPTDDKAYIVVTEVTEGSNAENSGILANDVILKVDDEEISTLTQISKVLHKKLIGDTIKLTIVRTASATDNTKTELEITINLK